eukprot:gene15077-16633_t
MQLTIAAGETVFPVDVSGEIELENFKALLEFESSVPAKEISMFLNGQLLSGDKKSLDSLGVKDGDVLLLIRNGAGQASSSSQSTSSIPATRPLGPGPSMASSTSGAMPTIDWGAVRLPTSNSSRPTSAAPHNMQRPSSSTPARQRPNMEDPAHIRQLFLSDPNQMSLLKERNPPLADALLSGNLEEFTRVLQEQRKQRFEQEAERVRLLTADPFDLEAQRKISEEIRMQNINSNMETAMEYQPEAFGQVFMLYIDCKVNGHPVKAFVDSGAQMTIMSQSCAERCGITRLIDHRWAGTAVGVGTQKIIGRVHLGQMQIEKDFLPTSFTILEQQPMDILLGLDMLKRHQCCIDLDKNVLKIGTTGTVTSFLAEADLPECARLNARQLQSEGSTTPTTTSMQEEEDRMLAEAMAKSAAENTPKQ